MKLLKILFHIVWSFFFIVGTAFIASIVIMIMYPMFPSRGDVKLDKEKGAEIVFFINMYGKIKSMDDGTRCFKSINGKFFDAPEFSTSCNNGENPNYKDLLKELKIDLWAFLYVRELLEESKLRTFCKEEDSIFFTVDGFTPNNAVWGYAYIPTKKYPFHEKACGHTYVIGKKLGDNWYSF